MRKKLVFVFIFLFITAVAVWYAQKIYQSDITVTNPKKNQVVVSPLNIFGQASGSWFFEGQAPVKILDSKGNILGNSVITTKGDWKTASFVPFSGEISFTKPAVSAGQLIIEKDNPSGLPQNNKQFIIPIRFTPGVK